MVQKDKQSRRKSIESTVDHTHSPLCDLESQKWRVQETFVNPKKKGKMKNEDESSESSGPVNTRCLDLQDK